MLSILFVILIFAVFGKLIGLAFRATWGITKLLLSFVLLPVILICLVFGGLIFLAIPILIIVGIVALIDAAT